MIKISTNKVPQAVGPYSQAVEVNGFIFLSGQIPILPVTNEIVANELFPKQNKY